MSGPPKNTTLSAQPKVTRSANCYLSSMTRRWSPYHHRAMRLTDHHVVGIKRRLKPNTSPPHLTVKAETKQLGDIHMICGRTWILEQDIPNRSTDRGGVRRHTTMAIYSDVTSLITPGPNAADGIHLIYVTIWPDIEAPHTLFASLMK